VAEYLFMEKEAVGDELDMYGGPSDNQLSNAALELVALIGMELPRANGNQTFLHLPPVRWLS
jgi:hypothetical protein